MRRTSLHPWHQPVRHPVSRLADPGAFSAMKACVCSARRQPQAQLQRNASCVRLRAVHRRRAVTNIAKANERTSARVRPARSASLSSVIVASSFCAWFRKKKLTGPHSAERWSGDSRQPNLEPPYVRRVAFAPPASHDSCSDCCRQRGAQCRCSGSHATRLYSFRGGGGTRAGVEPVHAWMATDQFFVPNRE